MKFTHDNFPLDSRLRIQAFDRMNDAMFCVSTTVMPPRNIEREQIKPPPTLAVVLPDLALLGEIVIQRRLTQDEAS